MSLVVQGAHGRPDYADAMFNLALRTRKQRLNFFEKGYLSGNDIYEMVSGREALGTGIHGRSCRQRLGLKLSRPFDNNEKMNSSIDFVLKSS